MKILDPERKPSKLQGIINALFLLLFIGALCWGCYYYSRPLPAPPLKISACENAEILKAGTKDWLIASPEMALFSGDQLRTGPFGRVDIVSPLLSLRAEEYSQILIRPSLRLAPFLRLQLERGSLFVQSEGQPVRIAVPFSSLRNLISRDEILSDFLSFFTLTFRSGALYINIAQDSAAAAVWVYKENAALWSMAGLRRFTLYENNKVLFYQQSHEVDTLPLKEEEKSQIQTAFKKMMVQKNVPQSPSPKPASLSPTKTPAQTPETKSVPGVLPAEALDQAKVFKTKSSSASSRFMPTAEGGPFLYFEYELPNPDCVAGIQIPIPEESLKKISGLEMILSAEEALALPENFRIEIRSQDRVLRSLAVKTAAMKEWQTFHFPFTLSSKDAVSEISLVITYAKAGTAKKGGFKIKRLSLLS